MGAVAQSAKSAAKYSIGQVLEKLSGEFEDLTPSKLRFLEDQGLITPERTGRVIGSLATRILSGCV